MMNITELDNMTLSELQDMARDMGISGYSRLKKQDLVFRLLEIQTEQAGQIFRTSRCATTPTSAAAWRTARTFSR